MGFASHLQDEEDCMAKAIGWHNSEGGRQLVRKLVGGKVHLSAVLVCHKCEAQTAINCTHSLLPDNVLDRKMRQRGWEIDPPICPTCRNTRAKDAAPAAASTTTQEETSMATGEAKTATTPLMRMGLPASVVEANNPKAALSDALPYDPSATKTASTAAVRGTIGVIRALDDVFNATTGTYADGWSDERIAKENGIALDRVIAFRLEGYGELAAPSEFQQLSEDVKALGLLLREADNTLQTLTAEVGNITARLAQLQRQVKR
jgi:hypothetical protein